MNIWCLPYSKPERLCLFSAKGLQLSLLDGLRPRKWIPTDDLLKGRI